MQLLKKFLFLLLLSIGAVPAIAQTQVIFLIDGSGSVDINEYLQIHRALQQLQLPPNLRKGHVHFVEWATGPIPVVDGPLDDFKNVVQRYFEKGRQVGGATGVGYALNFVMQEVYDPKYQSHYVIIITDGDNNIGPSPLETNYRSWSIINKVNTSIIIIDDNQWLLQYYAPLKIGSNSLIVHARDYNELQEQLQNLVNSIFTK
jgi:hypothetical protein